VGRTGTNACHAAGHGDGHFAPTLPFYNEAFRKEASTLKSTGIVRPVDNLGRIVLPIELRRMLDIDKDAALEVYVDSDVIVLKKYQPACIFCGSAEQVQQYEGRNICGACRAKIAAL